MAGNMESVFDGQRALVFIHIQLAISIAPGLNGEITETRNAKKEERNQGQKEKRKGARNKQDGNWMKENGWNEGGKDAKKERKEGIEQGKKEGLKKEWIE